MAKTIRFGILRGRYDSRVPTIPDSVCNDVLIVNINRRAVFQFWEDNSHDFLDLQGTMLPWIDFELTQARVESRRALAQEIFNLTVAAGNNLNDYQAFIVLLLPGAPVEIPNPNAGQPGEAPTIIRGIDCGGGFLTTDPRFTVTVPILTTDHTFMCHEVGHAIGMTHTYGVLSARSATEQSYRYGDPYDIMSSATFGSLPNRWGGDPTFAGPVVPGWPNAAAFATMGCAPARANLHFWGPEALPGNRVRVVDFPPASPLPPIRIYRASSVEDRTTLLVVRSPNEPLDKTGRCFVEFRDASGWDQGLDLSGNGLARQAVVVHAIAFGDSEEGVRCWYRGRILVPLEFDPDVSVQDLPLTVTVTFVDPKLDYVEVTLRETQQHRLGVLQYVRDVLVGVSDEERVERIPCGTVRVGTYSLQRESRFEPSLFGYGGANDGTARPTRYVSWTVGGLPVADGIGILAIRTTDFRAVTVTYRLDPETRILLLTANPADGAYSATVTCTATEDDGSQRLTESETFRPIGTYTGVHPLDRTLLTECMGRIVQRLRLRPRDLLIPPIPDPWHDPTHRRANRIRIESLAQTIAQASPAAANELRHMGDLQFGSNPAGDTHDSKG